MVSFELDKNNNIVIGSNFFLLSGNEALAQDVKTSLLMIKGEYPYNVNLGLNYLDYLQTQNKQLLLADIEKRVASDKRVKQVELTPSKSGSKLTINMVTTSKKEVSIDVG